ncbi:TetR/AcrR family transcriptional regulator [Tardiphaga alba]|uniref:TetR/AcrR family transcriptional regulator n=1 Tax=Tardiphaga alba TaxID=340268 RepID=A0ABX8AE26_9BRAD|nr:TetR/AcrR family transcriptional regulator [Tardiphaga alba]
MIGRPTKEEAAEIAERILDGARSVFCKRGIDGASIDKIAARLKLSKHTIYRRYAGKTSLLEAVAVRDIHRFGHQLAQAYDCADTAIDGLRETARRYVEIGSSRDYAAFYLGAWRRPSGPRHCEDSLRLGRRFRSNPS